jgi:hypothetical protein
MERWHPGAGSGLPFAAFPVFAGRLFHRETKMFRIMPNSRRPSLGVVLASVAVTIAWWAGLCVVAGRPVWFW